MKLQVFFPVAGLLLLAVAPPLAARQDPAPPPADGKFRLLAVATAPGGALAGPAGFTAHFAEAEKGDAEVERPAGAYFEPPAGHHRVWLEGEEAAGKEWMSPFARRVDVAATPEPGSSRLTLPVVPAGRVTLPGGMTADANVELRLYHLADEDYRGEERWELWRKALGSEVGPGLRMPRGKTVGLVWHRVMHQVLSLSRPFDLQAGETRALPAVPPVLGEDLLLRLRRASVPAPEGSKAAAEFRAAGRKYAPELLVPTAGAVYAVFYGLPSALGELVADAGHDTLPFRTFEPKDGVALTLDLALVRRPTLTVRFDLPDGLRGPTTELVVSARGGKEPVARKQVGDAKVLELRDLPAMPLQVELVSPVGTVREGADLSSGEDVAMELKAEANEVYGRVFLGDEPAAGKLEFLATSGAKVLGRSDEHGDYKVLAVAPLRFADIELDARPGKPFREFFTNGTVSAGERDFHLPDTAVAVKVVDAISGKGIPEAKVRIKNSSRARDRNGELVPPRTPGGELPIVSQLQAAVAGKEGNADVYYLNAGTVEISALAEGYQDSPAPEKLTLAENQHAKVEVRLQPQGKQAILQVLLPGGAPAAGAAAFLIPTVDSLDVLATATAGPDGKLKLPEAMAGAVLVVRHAQAGFLFSRWQPRPAPEEAKIELPPAAERPLTVRAKVRGEALPYAEVMLIVDGARMSPHRIFQLTGANPLTGQDGVFSAGSMPQTAIKVLIFSRADPEKAEAVRQGQYDNQAVEIPYPWPPLVEVDGIE